MQLPLAEDGGFVLRVTLVADDGEPFEPVESTLSEPSPRPRTAPSTPEP
jgi:hypothetical protein